MSKNIKHNLAKELCEGKYYRLWLPIFIMIGSFSYHFKSYAENNFNIHALRIGDDFPDDIDLSIFNTSKQPPGEYWVDTYLNKESIDTGNVEFILNDGELRPKLTVQKLQDLGVKINAFPVLMNLSSEEVITNISEYIPSASTQFDFNRQRLDISIPQIALNHQVRGYISPESWDQGMTALLVNYHYSGSTHWQDNRRTNQSNYLNLQTGVNWQAWRLRNYSTYTSQRKNWRSIKSYLQRDIHALKGQLIVGDSFTPSYLFDGIEFRGIQLASDENMLPDSMKGFAPVVSGIAQSHAQVTIKQNGYVIYQTYVAQGPFILTDLYPTTTSGNLEIIIKEADGRERRFIQPFSAAPIMLRKDSLKYSLTMGHYRSPYSHSRKPYFFQGTLIYGLHNNLTAYGGVMLSRDYQSMVLGSGIDLGNFGSLSFDATHANTQLPSDKKSQGQAYRLQYLKALSLTGTNLTVAGYRYSTKGFYDFDDANHADNLNSNNRLFGRINKKSKLQVQVNQILGDFGGLYVTAFQQDYWGQSGHERGLGAGYNMSHRGINYGLNYTYSRTPGSGNHDQLFSFSVHVPLDRWLKNSWASYSLTSGKNSPTSQQVSLNGTVLEDNNLHYSLQQSYTNQGDGVSGNIYAGYKGAYGRLNAGYNYQHHGRQLNYGISGGIIAHPYGLTFSQELGETAVLVRAEGAKGVKVANNTGVTTDWNGYAVVPYASSYRKNRVALDPHSFADDVDIDINTQFVVPTKGALTLANFQTRVGSRVLMFLSYQGQPVPFGAIATLEKQHDLDKSNSTIVSSEGQAYFTGMPARGKLQVKWGSQNAKTCLANYTLPEKQTLSGHPLSGIYTMKVNCE
ncbi:fimbria/pilus outer membrane usher protein [Xenorhabdus bovienii]|uniref:fimbria/pilus outer membrane usher protein n=1 Tax=Xenorhabdus bovienii TaxID=40576 RepID=UPI0023B23241|nr:fimbria/pilus outer membrane usher protein [Xenorhabdus bovienii]MDE9539337.1 fimbrial biogenesis outer membrane usher protein [Xenorhabdus bovienii]